MRNDEAFALLPRKDATRMVEAVASANRIVDILTAISTYRQAGAQIPVDYPCEWLNAFDMDDIMDFLREVHQAFRRAMGGEIPWDDFETVIYEWHESAMALRSEVLATAFAAPGDEVPLTEPVVTADCGADA